eukprot:CAMPEP_0114238796 /NCGR_PEP_ID=MMETSP0058-20121206/8112_1 /TAXON_ID=36894 /ORGANISM="Pyramimonas parkeae, CCMP726" /LENGTH=279 /DNA_ID=CAMNT_0001350923 /DNA_START=411 /DNA_END=1250 /DNA_ORIENTATION=+
MGGKPGGRRNMTRLHYKIPRATKLDAAPKDVVYVTVDPSNCVPEWDRDSPTDWKHKIGPPSKHSRTSEKGSQHNHKRAKHFWECEADEFRGLFPQLVEYWKEFGDSKVPSTYRYNRMLGDFVHCKRRQYRRGTLPEYARVALEAVRMTWKMHVQEAQWYFMVTELRAFRLRYGHARVPPGFLEPAGDINVDLCGWADKQRHSFQTGKLLPRYERRLRMEGFDLGDLQAALVGAPRSIFDHQLGTTVTFDPRTNTWSYTRHQGRTSVNPNTFIRINEYKH